MKLIDQLHELSLLVFELPTGKRAIAVITHEGGKFTNEVK